MHIVGLKSSNFPLKYLRVPIVSSRLTKIDCNALVEMITARVHTWATRNISYAGRLVLINSVLFGTFSFWGSVFLLPNEVIEKITQISRNSLWSGAEDFRKPPHIPWQTSCLPKSYGGLGIKDFAARNKASIAKLV